MLYLRSRIPFVANNHTGYVVASQQETHNGLTIQLTLAGPACNAFGHDVANLTVEVTYETTTRYGTSRYNTDRGINGLSLFRLHVNIYDTEQRQFTIPPDVVPLSAGDDDTTLPTGADLEFHHNTHPFEFWVTRRSEPDATPLFDTRLQSLPPTPIPAWVPGDNSTAFDGFPLVFEDQYLQLTSALPHGANVYGLGEVLASSGFRRDVGTDGGSGTLQTFWARDSPDPIDENMQVHPLRPKSLR